MVPQKKIFAVDNLAAKLKDAKGLVFADYQGLNVTQMITGLLLLRIRLPSKPWNILKIIAGK